MERFLERKLADLQAGKGGPVTVFILLAILFLCVADVFWANPKNKLKANSPIFCKIPGCKIPGQFYTLHNPATTSRHS